MADDVAIYEARVDALVREDDDLLGYVSRLETMGYDEDDDDEDDDVVGGELTDDAIDVNELDSDELMAEVERFLRDQPDS